MKGIEKNQFTDCAVGDWVLCDGKFKGSAKVMVNPSMVLAVAAANYDPPNLDPHQLGYWEFHRTPVEKSHVIMAWLRVR